MSAIEVVDAIFGAGKTRFKTVLGGRLLSTAERERVKELEREVKEQNQPGFDITPKMRESAANGLPLFSRRAASHTPMPSCTSTFMRLARRLANK